MSDNEGTPLGEVKLSARDRAWLWVWGSIVATLGLWVFAAYHPFLKNLVATTDGKGQIGDFLGGVSAPVFGFVGMVLVYRSFQAQVESNRQQIQALEDERTIRREDEQQKAIEDTVSRLNGILEHACYERCHKEPHHVFTGVSAIFHFCMDMMHDRAGTVFEHNAVLADVIGLWLFEANSALRQASAVGPDHFESLRAHLQPLYAFALSRSINTLVEKHGAAGAFAEIAIQQVRDRKGTFDRALDGHFGNEDPA